MHSTTFFTAALAAVIGSAAAQTVSGTPEGFGAGTTGGAAGETVTPTSTDELVSYLTADEAYTILITQTFDFTGTEGTTTETGCAPWGTDSACQLAINADDWCTNYESDAASVSVTYDVAGTTAIDVASDKTILGVGSAGVIKGKGFRLANGVSNIIIQNIQITDLNPQYVWGGDAITLDGSSNVWIDHVTVSLIGRMFIVTGYEANTAVTISNCKLDGETSWSASCDGYHYWTLFFTGDGDQITFKNNYVYHTSGRSPKVDEGSVVHIVNNYWSENSGHCFEGEGGYAVVEGNTFETVTAMESGWGGAMFASASDSSTCSSYIGRDCMANAYTDGTPTMEYSDTSALEAISGLEIADAVDAASAKSAASDAGSGSVSGSSTTSSGSGTGSSNSTSASVSSAAYSSVAVASSSAASVAPYPMGTGSSSAYYPTGTAASSGYYPTGTAASSGYPVVAAVASASASAVPSPSEDDGDCGVQLIYV